MEPSDSERIYDEEKAREEARLRIERERLAGDKWAQVGIWAKIFENVGCILCLIPVILFLLFVLWTLFKH